MHMQICLHTQYTHVQKKKDDLGLQMAEHRATGDRRVSRAFLTPQGHGRQAGIGSFSGLLLL